MMIQTQIGSATTLPLISMPRAVGLQAPASLLSSPLAPRSPLATTSDRVELGQTSSTSALPSTTPPVWMRHLLIGAVAGAATGALTMGGIGMLAHATFAEGAALGAWLGGVPGALVGPVDGALEAWLAPNKDVAFDNGYRPVTAAVAGAAIGALFPLGLVGMMFI